MITENKVVPKLRFREFNDYWNNYLLGNIAEFLKGKGISKSELDDDGKTECIRYGELYVYYNELIDEVKSKTNLENTVLSKANDVIIPASGETQLDIATCSCVLRSGIALGGDLNIIRTKNNGLFLSYYLNSKKKFDIARLSQGSSVVHIYASQLKKLNLNLPSLIEQKKVASFLSAVDEKLKQLTKKKELSEDYKKGIMQKIFSREIRFKDDNGNNYSNWEKKRLEEVIYFFNGKGHEQDVSSDGLFIIVNSKFISTNGKVKKYTNLQKCPLQKDNIVMVMSDVPNGKALAKCYYIEKDNLYSLNQRICSLKQKSINMRFLFYLLNRNKYFLKFDSGVGQTNIKKSEVLSCPLYIPSSIKEQQSIAEFFTEIDKKIEFVSHQLEKTKEFKKGLLQQMFV